MGRMLSHVPVTHLISRAPPSAVSLSVRIAIPNSGPDQLSLHPLQD